MFGFIPTWFARIHWRFVFPFFLLVCLSSISSIAVGAVVYNLADDWSDTQNPNGPWSYNQGPNAPISTHWDNWHSNGSYPQPTWAYAQAPYKGHVPVWYKAVAGGIGPDGGIDTPPGIVGMHGTSGISSVVSTPAGVSWTSPFNTEIQISGGIWLANKAAGRSMAWTLYVNNSPVSSGNLTSSDPFNSDNHFLFENGTGGPSALSHVVSAGDIINLEIVKTSLYADFVGIDLTITAGSALPVRIGTVSLPDFHLGEISTQSLFAIRGTPSFSWSIVDGTLPNGLALTSDGQLQGTPSEEGTFSITAHVTDATTATDERSFDVVVKKRTVWDLTDDWSDTQNPNGAWAYESPVGSLLTTHWFDWDPQGCCFTSTQPAWANAQWPGFEHEAVWFKTVSPTVVSDLPIGTVGTHGLAGGPGGTGITWTSPVTGYVQITGGTWLANKVGRSMDWAMFHNGSPLSQANLTSSDPFTSANPMEFSAGSGGTDALTVFVSQNDVISLQYGPPSGFAEFVGADLRITKLSPPSALEVRPNKGGNTGQVTATIHGSGFQEGTTVKLSNAVEPDIIGSMPVVLVSGTQLVTTFNLTGKSLGLRDVVITNPDASIVTLTDNFTIEEGQSADVWVDIVGLDVIRVGRAQRFCLVYGNRGNIDSYDSNVWLAHIPIDSDLTINSDYSLIPLPIEIEDPSEANLFIETIDEKILPIFIEKIYAGTTGSLCFSITITNPENFSLEALLEAP